MSDLNKKPKLTIQIPEIDLEIFEKRIIDGIPTINKPIKCKSAYDYWKDLDDDELFKNIIKNKNINNSSSNSNSSNSSSSSSSSSSNQAK